MSRYYFAVNYHGVMATDDIGEDFATLHEARAHAAVVAGELSRNGSELVTVHVLGEDQRLVSTVRPTGAFNPFAKLRTCAACGGAMRQVTHVPAFGHDPALDAYECPNCGHLESVICDEKR